MRPVDVGHAGVLQQLRAAVLGSLVLALAAGAHVLGGGALPAPALLLLLVVLVAAASAALARARPAARGRLRHREVVPVLALGQAALHGLLAALSAPVAAASVAPLSPGGHVHGLLPRMPRPGGTAAEGPLAAVLDQATSPMLLAHVVATLVTSAAVVAADRAWASAVAWATRVLPVLLVLLRGPLDGPTPRVRLVPVRRRTVPVGVVVAALPHRGPPRVLAAA